MSYADMEISGGGGKYLRIESGKPVDIHIVTKSEDIKTKDVHYDGSKYHDCMPGCEFCAEGNKSSKKYTIQVLDRKDGAVKLLEFSTNIAIGIKEIAKVLELDGQTIHDIDLRISRVSEKPVRYQVVQRKMAGPLPDEEVPF